MISLGHYSIADAERILRDMVTYVIADAFCGSSCRVVVRLTAAACYCGRGCVFAHVIAVAHCGGLGGNSCDIILQ